MRAAVVSLFLLALLLPAAFLPASLGQARAAAAAELEILSFGSGSSEINVVLDGDKLSLFANQVSADLVLRHLKAVGGPTYSSLEPLTRPINLSLHGVTWEAMLRRMLMGYNCSFHYKGSRVDHVRILHLTPTRPYKTPRLLQSRAEWTRQEQDSLQARTRAVTSGSRSGEGAGQH
jgi:hypothetical protein